MLLDTSLINKESANKPILIADLLMKLMANAKVAIKDLCFKRKNALLNQLVGLPRIVMK